ncbi:MAG: phage tail sheath subtilisin-like domain-containing protein [Myxococcales bacterium]|nr:phage tail sheath subtilisin-like domain-containing protein [Myxococcales bacterium]
MPIQPTYPGVYVEEISSGSKTITGVSTSVPVFLSMASRGPVDKPVSILSFADYERAFGQDTSKSELADQVRQYFVNGGQRAYVMRIVNADAGSSSLEIANEAGAATLKLEAREPGLIGNTIRAEVDYETASPEATFNMKVYRSIPDSRGDLQEVDTELYRDLTMDPSAGRYAVDLLNQTSSLVTAAPAAAMPASFAGYSVAGTTLGDSAGTPTFGPLDTAITAAGGTGKFQISVDGSAWATVSLSTGASLATIDTALSAALSPLGVSATAGTDQIELNVAQFLHIKSGNTSGGSVRIRRAADSDIAQAMQMGHGDGGLEVDGFALRRPAPSGFFAKIGTISDPATLDGLQEFMVSTKAGNDSLTMTADGLPYVVSVTYAGAGLSLGMGALGHNLISSGENMDTLIAGINVQTGSLWTAVRTGYRMTIRSSSPYASSGDGLDIDSLAELSITTDYFMTGAAPSANIKAYLGGAASATNYEYITASADGSDGSMVVPGDYDDAYEVIDREVDYFSLLALPRTAEQSDNDRAGLWPAASAFAKAQRAFLVMDPPSAWNSAQAAADGIAALRTGLVKDHAALYWPRVRVTDPVSGKIRAIDPCGSIIGLMARTDSSRGIWKAPAGTDAALYGARGVEYAMSDGENGLINPAAVNGLRAFPSGLVSWGARTMDGFDNSGNDDFKYVPVRRLSLFLEESLSRGLRFALFEANDAPLWAQIRLAAGSFMHNLHRQGAFAGQRARDAYFVKCDSESTTQNDINLGIVNVLVGFAPLKPAEFVILKIQQKAGEVQV